MSVNYLNLSSDSYENKGFGLGFSYRLKQTKDTFHNFSANAMYTYGDFKLSEQKSETYIFSASYEYGKELTPELIGFVGGNLNYSEFSQESPSSSISLAPEIYTDTIMYAANVGLQYEHPVSFGALIPWVALTYVLGGSSDIEIYRYTSGGALPPRYESNDVESFGAYQLGFDIYFDSIATSLSSMYQTSDDGNMFSLTMNYNF